MAYSYIKVSTNKQTVDNQRFEIERFCTHKELSIDHWIEETKNGVQLPEKRLLGSLLDGAKTGNLIICQDLAEAFL